MPGKQMYLFGWEKHHSHPQLVSQISANNYIDYMKNLFE